MTLFYRCKACNRIFCVEHRDKHKTLKGSESGFIFIGYSDKRGCIICNMK